MRTETSSDFGRRGETAKSLPGCKSKYLVEDVYDFLLVKGGSLESVSNGEIRQMIITLSFDRAQNSAYRLARTLKNTSMISRCFLMSLLFYLSKQA